MKFGSFPLIKLISLKAKDKIKIEKRTFI